MYNGLGSGVENFNNIIDNSNCEELDNLNSSLENYTVIGNESWEEWKQKILMFLVKLKEYIIKAWNWILDKLLSDSHRLKSYQEKIKAGKDDTIAFMTSKDVLTEDSIANILKHLQESEKLLKRIGHIEINASANTISVNSDTALIMTKNGIKFTENKDLLKYEDISKSNTWNKKDNVLQAIDHALTLTKNKDTYKNLATLCTKILDNHIGIVNKSDSNASSETKEIVKENAEALKQITNDFFNYITKFVNGVLTIASAFTAAIYNTRYEIHE